MSKVSTAAQEFIQSSFSPNIAILTNHNVDSVMHRNNLTFPELLQPFTALEWEGTFREAAGGSVFTVKNWKLCVKDVYWKPLQPTEARKLLNNAVLNNFNEQTKPLDLGGRKCDIPQSTPWFDAWRETYLEVQFPSDHEFTKHFLSCILVGTITDENVVDTFYALNQQFAQLQNVTPPKLPKWFNSSVLKTYLLLHDVSAISNERAEASFETLKQNFGAANCFMLSINSKSTVDPAVPTDYWRQCIKRTSGTINIDTISSNPISPLESQTISTSSPVVVTEDSSTQVSLANQETTAHPLTTNEVDVYDSANSLQTHSFSGSSESVNTLAKNLDYQTEIHGSALNSHDIEAIKKFLKEYATKALLPYMEKQIHQLSEVVANRKGVSRSLFSATKRWFGTGKPGTTTGSNNVIYSNDCPELQLRRLGDLWFLCGQWQRAFDTYHTAKREFYADNAWLCYAGALEMAALSAFMAGDANKKTHGYMEESITTYLNTCRMVQYAVRATLLSVLCLTGCGLHGEAAKQLIRMTSEDSDLRSAMLLEQAALCFLSGPGSKAMCRKYAFHMVLSGHRFSKAGQKKHAYRCYLQAYQVYGGSGWRLSADHVQFALGRLAAALRQARAAVRWLAGPLAPAAPHHQPRDQQDAYLREYMLAHQQWIESSEEFKSSLPALPLPLVERGQTAVLCVGPAPLSAPGRRAATSVSLAPPASAAEDKYWAKLEEMLLQAAQGSVPMIFKPTVDLHTDRTDTNPIVPQGEPITVSIALKNPLKIALLLKDVELLWRFAATGGGPAAARNEPAAARNEPAVARNEPATARNEPAVARNEPAAAARGAPDPGLVHGEKHKAILLEGDSSKTITFSLTPLCVGQLCVEGLAYKLINASTGGIETNDKSVAIAGKINFPSESKQLQITVIPHAPCLQMTFSETSADIIDGEIRSVDVEFRNVGPVDMEDLYLAVSHPDCVSLVTPETEVDDFQVLYDDKYRVSPTFSDERGARAHRWCAAAARATRRVRGVPRGGCERARLLLRPRAGASALLLLAHYAAPAHPRRYRLLRHVFRFRLTEAVETSVTPKRSLRKEGDDVLENMNLVLDFKNVSYEKDLDIQLLEVSLLSRQWRLTDLFGANVTKSSLIPRERIYLVLRARRLSEPLREGALESTCLKIIEDPDSLPNVNVLPYSKFITEYRTSIVDASELSTVKGGDDRSGLIRSMVVLRWRACGAEKDETIIGQHCLWLDSFSRVSYREVHRPLTIGEAPTLQINDFDSKMDLLRANNKKDSDIIIFNMEHSNRIIHNFKDRKLCLVPITVNVVNCYGVPVTVFIDMSKLREEDGGDGGDGVGWVGALSQAEGGGPQRLGASLRLGSHEAGALRLQALVAAPGAYVLGPALAATATAATAATQGDRLHVAQPSPNTTLLVVQQAL